MARKSSIHTLDPEIRARIDALLKDGRHTLDQITAQIQAAYPDAKTPSRSALGRYSKSIEEVGKHMREAREVARVWAERLGNEPQGDIGKVVMELLRTLAFDATLDMRSGAVEMDPKALNALALAMQRLESAGVRNVQREQAMRQAVLDETAAKLDAAATREKLDPAVLARIRAEIYGGGSGVLPPAALPPSVAVGAT